MSDITVTYKAAHSNYSKAISLSLQTYYFVRYVCKSEKLIRFKPSPHFSAFFPPCCCSICCLQNPKPWALQPSPPSNWMMPSVSCGGRTSPPLLTRCPSSRTGMGMRDVPKGDLPTCMPLWKDSISTKSTRAFLLQASTLQGLLLLPLSRSMGWPARDGCPGCNGWAGCGLNMRCWFLSGSQGPSQELCCLARGSDARRNYM